MKAKSSSRLISSARCQHRTATGRKCCSLAGDRSSGLCPRHSAPRHVPSLNFREALTREAADFQNAQGVNNSLGALYNLLAEGSISPPMCCFHSLPTPTCVHNQSGTAFQAVRRTPRSPATVV